MLRRFAGGAMMMGLASVLACTSPVSSSNGKNSKYSAGCLSDSECRPDYYCGYGTVGNLDCAGKVCLPK